VRVSTPDVCLCLCLLAEFHVSETPCGRVTDPKKLAAIKQVLSLPEHTGAQRSRERLT
jgi:hypothetical protein